MLIGYHIKRLLHFAKKSRSRDQLFNACFIYCEGTLPDVTRQFSSEENKPDLDCLGSHCRCFCSRTSFVLWYWIVDHSIPECFRRCRFFLRFQFDCCPDFSAERNFEKISRDCNSNRIGLGRWLWVRNASRCELATLDLLARAASASGLTPVRIDLWCRKHDADRYEARRW